MTTSLNDKNHGSIPSRHFIFTITTGRSGTSFLAKLLALNLNDAQVHHEQLGYGDWGVNTPDMSHLTTFNHIGCSSHVRAFWTQKLFRLRELDVRYYAETSHMLVNAGLMENLDDLTEAGSVHLIYLKRDIAKTVISFINREDFLNSGNMWLWYLDPDYPNVIVSPKSFMNLGQLGFGLWYVIEMRVRAEYYRLLLAGRNNIIFHEADMEDLVRRDGAAKLLADLGSDLSPSAVLLPGRENANLDNRVSESGQQRIMEIVNAYTFDAVELAHGWYEKGNRLSTPVHAKALVHNTALHR